MDLTTFRYLADLERRGISLQVQAGRIGFIDPGKQRTKADLDFAKAFKSELLETLALDPDEFRVGMAAAIFDAAPVSKDEAQAIAEWEALTAGMTVCDFCGTSYNRELRACYRCTPKVWREALGPDPVVPERSVEAMALDLSEWTEADRAAYRKELANTPAEDPAHPFEQMALDRAEELRAVRREREPGAAD